MEHALLREIVGKKPEGAIQAIIEMSSWSIDLSPVFQSVINPIFLLGHAGGLFAATPRHRHFFILHSCYK